MTANQGVAVGFLAGLLFAAVMLISTLMQFVQSDMDGFRKWLDKKEA